MNSEYANEVGRFGSARLRDKVGKPLNISHSEDLNPDQVRTDGRGNVVGSPLIWRKDCWGRPERFARGHVGARQWQDDRGDRYLSKTPCHRCEERSAGVYKACSEVVDERVRSSSAIEDAMEAWLTACGDDFGPVCFTGQRARLWRAFLQTIIDHGGWTSVNDEQVKVEAIRLAAERRKGRNEAARAHRERQRQARRGTPRTITGEYLQALQAERTRKAALLKQLRALSGRTSRDMLWLTNLPDVSCDRIADVWWARELLTRGGYKITGKAIAECMIAQGRSYGLSCPSLTTRVHDDLKRIMKFESNLVGAPIWAPWVFSV